jgi:hypothetical protein
VWFSVAEAAVMLVMGVWQTLSLRAYFIARSAKVWVVIDSFSVASMIENTAPDRQSLPVF